MLESIMFSCRRQDVANRVEPVSAGECANGRKMTTAKICRRAANVCRLLPLTKR
jgi:hypothetical protein